MTLSGSEKYSKRKLDYDGNDGDGFASNPKLHISLRSSILILGIIFSVIVLKFLVVLSEYYPFQIPYFCIRVSNAYEPLG